MTGSVPYGNGYAERFAYISGRRDSEAGDRIHHEESILRIHIRNTRDCCSAVCFRHHGLLCRSCQFRDHRAREGDRPDHRRESRNDGDRVAAVAERDRRRIFDHDAHKTEHLFSVPCHHRRRDPEKAEEAEILLERSERFNDQINGYLRQIAERDIDRESRAYLHLLAQANTAFGRMGKVTERLLGLTRRAAASGSVSNEEERREMDIIADSIYDILQLTIRGYTARTQSPLRERMRTSAGRYICCLLINTKLWASIRMKSERILR